MIGEEDKINEDPNESDDSGNIADEMEEISDDGRFSRTSGAQTPSGKFGKSSPAMLMDRQNFWRKMPLTRVVNIPAVHMHAIELCTTVGLGNSNKDPDAMSVSEMEDASWQCNGTQLFQDGCKSG